MTSRSTKYLSVNDQGYPAESTDELIELRHRGRLSGGAAPKEHSNGVPKSKSRLCSRRTATKLWALESACYIIALGCLVAIIALLRAFDSHPIPKWRYGITLNAIVSLLATVLVFTLTVPVSASLGQLKWLRMRQERPLMDFELIENASRGPLGGAMLLIRAKGGFLACFGACLVIDMLAIGPFVQQIINNGTQVVQSSTGASIPIAHHYAVPIRSNGIISADVDLEMKSAIMGGLLSMNTSESQFNVPISCTTGNCTWPQYTTLAACASCTDLTDKITVTTKDSNTPGYARNVFHRLPNGVSLKTYEGQVGIQMTVVNSQENGTSSIAFKSHNNTILDMFALALDNETSMENGVFGPYAVECILEFCAQSFTAVVANGTFLESRTGKGAPVDYYPVDNDIGGWETEQGGQVYGVEFNTLKAFWFYLPILFQGHVSWSDSSSPVPIFPSDLTQSVWEHLKQPPHDLRVMFSNIENAMTRALRIHPNGTETFHGFSLVQQSVIRVDWDWISLPAVLMILVLVFFVTTAIYTQRSGLEPWKESSIAILFHGLSLRDDGELSRLADEDEMDDVAKRTFVRLNSHDGIQALERIHIGS